MQHRKKLRRFYIEGAIYFITTYTKDRYPFFNEPVFCKLLSCQIKLGSILKSFTNYAYIIMPEHLHILIQPMGEYNISEIMQYIKKNSSININRLRYDDFDMRKEANENKDSCKKDSRELIEFKRNLREMKNEFQKKYKWVDMNLPKFAWHHQFYDHILRDNENIENYIDYILYNPIKHEIADDSVDYPWIYIRDSEDFNPLKR